jgi:dienelactone hydrolase
VPLLLFLLLLTPPLAQSQDWTTAARALRPSDTSAAQAALLDDIEHRARLALQSIPRATTAAEVENQRPELRQRLRESLGLHHLPWPPSLQAEVTGVIPQDGYRIEKIVFQSLPDVWVPAHLYIPDALTKPAPAVLFYNGHWWVDSKSRPNFQAFCINMARLGFVVLSFDPFGQGERGVSSRDHRRTEALLVGVAQQGIAEYETQCALEYLLSRPEVDANRIGITGASGGGFNTWIHTALDDRIKVAVPVVGTNDFIEQTRVTRPLDWYHAAEHCHYIPGLFQFANNHEFLSAAAPRPVLIITASEDQSFPIEGVRPVYEYGRELYSTLGAANKIRLFEDFEEGHGYQRMKREAAYGWFRRWLQNEGDGGPWSEPETETLPFGDPALSCFPDGRKRPAGPGIIATVNRLAKAPQADNPVDLDALLGAPPEEGQVTVGLNVAVVQRQLFNTQPGIDIPAFVLRPGPEGADPAAGVLVAIDDRGKEELASDPIVAEAVRRGWMVWAIDPRGIGELELEQPGWAFAISLMLGENFVWRQAWDIHRIVEAASHQPTHLVGLYARGHNASLAATYAIASGARTEWAVLREGFVSYRQFFERPESLSASYHLEISDVRERRKAAFDREIPHLYFPFQALVQTDLPALMTGARARVTLINPINGDWKPASPAEVPEALRTLLSTEQQFLEADW